MLTRMSTVRNGKVELIWRLIHPFANGNVKRILVVGCGTGKEAAILCRLSGADVVGIDVHNSFAPQTMEHLQLSIGDATKLSYPDQHFDIVYMYHVLEHIDDYMMALSECKRVLSQTGACFIGTPNRTRIAMAISSDGTLYAKLRANWADWKMRLAGKFANEYGAHAGFSRPELRGILKKFFSDVNEISVPYYTGLYAKYSGLIRLIHRLNLDRFIFPCVYFCGKK